jgi:hypothetical protein
MERCHTRTRRRQPGRAVGVGEARQAGGVLSQSDGRACVKTGNKVFGECLQHDYSRYVTSAGMNAWVQSFAYCFVYYLHICTL